MEINNLGKVDEKLSNYIFMNAISTKLILIKSLTFNILLHFNEN